jgi:hypothetical protein
VIKQLQEYVDSMDKDLGIKGKGPGVREPGQVENPKPLLMNQ